MADANLTAVPMASPGYGKQSAPGQAPRHHGDFGQLPPREACIAAFIDRLPDGASVDIKTLAKQIPAYGQQAVASALNKLSAAGHLRRFREPLGEGRTQWVSRTYFSRTPRDDSWWERFLGEGIAAEAPPGPVAVAASPPPSRSPAYLALVSLGRACPQLALSAAECADLEDLAGQWLEHGVTPADFVRILTTGLPKVIHSPGAFTRKRLVSKVPPEPLPDAHATTPPSRRVMECTGCGVPGRPEALSGGLCRACHGEPPPADPASIELPAPAGADVHALVSHLRTLARTSR
ncbi:hypothetical protein ABZ442_16900 [Streptomyces triculaminicus]|uniref:hypothetical protein n=1 Tax=Streptomyces triculaminicus TaxID=2816232 RepID=UPI0033EC3EB3